MSPLNSKLSEEIENNPLVEALTSLVQSYSQDYEFPRDTLLREIRRNDLYYMDIQNIWLSDDADGWRSFDDLGALAGDPNNVNILSDFDFKFVNIYSSYADSLIAALSVQVPATRFLPEDADTAADIYTAEAFGKIANLIRKNNKAKLLLIKLLAILYNHGAVCVYNYCDRDSKFGQATVPVRGVYNKATIIKQCSVCGETLDTEILPATVVEDLEQFSSETQDTIGEESMFCPNCQNLTIPIISQENNLQKGIVDFQDVNKIKEIQEAYGLSHVAFTPFVKSQSQIPVLVFEHEEDISLVEETYPHLRGKIDETNIDTPEENKWARQNPLYFGEIPKHTCTVKEYWIRPWAFNRIKDDAYIVDILTKSNEVPTDILPLEGNQGAENISDTYTDIDMPTVGQIKNNEDGNRLSDYLKEKYPTGLRLVLINKNTYAEHHEEGLDDHWTISICPTQQWLVAKAQGSKVVPIQDIKNDLINLKVDTVAHGIPENYVQQSIIDWNRYSNVEQRPGNTFPVNVDPNSSVSDNFHQTKPATLSEGVAQLDKDIEKDGQFVSGATPSIYGGSMEDSNTAAEYSMSRSQALQRLLITWASICYLWAEMESKSVKNFAKNLNYDEKYVEKSGTSAKNIWIKQVMLQGEVAEIEPEASESFPLTWGQKNDLIFKLLGLNNEAINEILGHSENIGKISEYIGSGELYIPGNDQRAKQLAEITLLLKINPLESETMLAANQPTVPIEPDVDEHDIHSKTCQAWLVSLEGQQTKRDNPEAYLNVLLHKKMHDMIVAQQEADMLKMQAQLQGQSNNKGGKNVPAPA